MGPFMPTNYRGLAFLLSIGSLPLACSKDDNDDSTTTANTTTGGTTGTGTDATDPTQATVASDPTNGTTTGATDGQTDTSLATTEPQPTTFLTSDSESAGTGFETESDTDLPPPTDPTCIAYGKHLAECIPRYARYETYFAQDCEYTKMDGMADGDACIKALEAAFVCLSMADCAEFTGDIPTACQREEAAAQAVCPSLNQTDTDTGTGGDSSTG